MFNHNVWRAMMVLAVLTLVIPTALAQDGEPDAEVIARVDQAMAHLSVFLNDATISRQSNFWTFEQLTFSDTSYGCPDPNLVYAQQTVEGYHLQIKVRLIDYNYYTNRDGTILILCYPDRPHPTSIGLDGSSAGDTTTPDATPPVTDAPQANLPTSQPLPPSDWYAVVYNASSDTLVWLNANGQQASMPRPKLPEETEFSRPKVQLSRDGRVLSVAATLTSGATGIGFYDLERGWWLKTHTAYQQGNVVEAVEFGGRFSSNASSSQMAVGFYTFGVTANWRVIVFDLTTGDPVYDISSVHGAVQTFIDETLDPTQVYRPTVVYFDYDDFNQTPIIHIQYIPIGTIPPDVPTLAWYPTGIPGLEGQIVTPSPFQRRGIDFNPVDGLAVFPHVDPTVEVLQTSDPSTAFNAVAVGSPLALSGYPGPFPRFTSATLGIGTARWADSGGTILFQAVSLDATGAPVTDWYATTSGITADPVRPPASGVLGLPTGYLIRGLDAHIYTHDGADLFDGAGQDVQLLWASVPETPFALTQVVTDTGLFFTPRPTPEGPVGPAETEEPSAEPSEAAEPQGASLCPGAPPSQVAVGSTARVAFAGIPLNVRDVPGGNRIATLNDGTVMTVNGGPQCQGVYTWWRIVVPDNGVSGWVAEGDLTRYYIEPQRVVEPR